MIKLIKAKIVNLFHYLYFWNAYFFSKVEKRIGNKSDVINYNDIDIINDSILLNNIPKVIWVFWYDENIPDLVQKCILNIRRINFDYEVKLLNKKNIVEYLDLN
ncbi:capsular polysaccharide synthesis protein, partial [Acinetobacter stercoris]|uniref:capsular polysaccharide synthesis protein n=1 Tax=Acinetobacter stercoris TaxID=2126983 RepID=UPI001BC86BC6